jgi:hypothetical protein
MRSSMTSRFASLGRIPFVHRLALAAASLLLVGCVRRTITVTSEPSGALCWLNGREVGRTPVTVDFLYYGEYDVQLQKDGYEPLVTHAKAQAPWWETIPLDLVAEVTPGRKHAKVEWHFALEPTRDDPAGLLQRARQVRESLDPPPPPSS